MAGGMIGAVIGGLAAGVAGLHHIGHQASLFSGLPEALGMAHRSRGLTDFFGGLSGLHRRFRRGYLAAVGLGLPAGLVNGLGVGLAVALVIETARPPRPSRTLPRWDNEIGLAGGGIIGLPSGSSCGGWQALSPALYSA